MHGEKGEKMAIYWISYYDEDRNEIVVGKLVKCKDCRWCKVDGGFRRCMMSAIIHPTADDYCSLGERKDAEINRCRQIEDTQI